MKDPTLRQLQEISALLNSSLDHATIRKRAIEAATLLMNAEAGSLLLLDEATGGLYFDVAHGEKGEAVRQARLGMGKVLQDTSLEPESLLSSTMSARCPFSAKWIKPADS